MALLFLEIFFPVYMYQVNFFLWNFVYYRLWPRKVQGDNTLCHKQIDVCFLTTSELYTKSDLTWRSMVLCWTKSSTSVDSIVCMDSRSSQTTETLFKMATDSREQWKQVIISFHSLRTLSIAWDMIRTNCLWRTLCFASISFHFL